EDLPASLLALAQALSVTERQLHGSLLNMGVVSLICGALFRGSLRMFLNTQRNVKRLSYPR
ncbi:hypothetical protein LYZ90_11740, partial [Xanthomonas hortorum pv. vitians]|uniref:hypothetical protein n=1 Tax=Xanthomonas hortorum TaxID=56454 RepID=UPI001F30B3E3